jgi:hypothetical protein
MLAPSAPKQSFQTFFQDWHETFRKSKMLLPFDIKQSFENV